MSLKIFLGWDDREPDVCKVAAKSLARVSAIEPQWLHAERLRDSGLLYRPVDRRGGKYDLISNAEMSTDFAVSRFLVPILCQQGWALFADGDVVFYRDPLDMLDFADPKYAVLVVKHEHEPTATVKMDGVGQTRYLRKNWSSVILWQCEHPANRRLAVYDVNARTGLSLHQFYWLHDSEIGALPPCWNWLVNEEPQPRDLAIAHFTNGCPGLPGWKGAPNDDLWLEAAHG